jgi:hypothetical protein
MIATDITNDSRIEALRRFGYSEREAAFLSLAGLHSGYFLRRQYVRFLGKTVGGTAAALIEKALANEHLRVCTYVGNIHLYHLASRPFYAALGQADNRNRRDRQPLTIKSKLMALDFVLEHSAHRYLATEREKVEYFTGLYVSQEALPAKMYGSHTGADQTTRYFVDKYPICIAAARNGIDSEVRFTYIDPGATTVSGFETYLDQYRPLFRALSLFRVMYVATRPFLFEAAERLFHRFTTQKTNSLTVPDGTVPVHLRTYFETRFLYEAGDLTSFDRGKLIQLRDQRLQRSDAETEGLYLQWRSRRQDAATAVSQQESAAATPLRGTFSVWLLEHNYDVFGDLTAF